MSVESAVRALVNQAVPEERRASFLEEHGLNEENEERNTGDTLSLRDSKATLQEEASERGIEYDDSTTKQELLDAIQDHDNNN